MNVGCQSVYSECPRRSVQGKSTHLLLWKEAMCFLGNTFHPWLSFLLIAILCRGKSEEGQLGLGPKMMSSKTPAHVRYVSQVLDNKF